MTQATEAPEREPRPEKVAEVDRLSERLTDSAAVLVADASGIDANMEGMMKAMGQVVPEAKRTLELNPGHAVMDKLKGILDADAEDGRVAEYAELLRDQALLTEGSTIQNPTRFAQLISKLMAS